MTEAYDRIFASYRVLEGVAHVLSNESRVEDSNGLTPAAWEAFETLQDLRGVVFDLTLAAMDQVTDETTFDRQDVRRWHESALGYVQACIDISTGYAPLQ